MNDLDIQVFPVSGTWRKPPRSALVNIVLQAGDGSVEKGKVATCSFLAEELPDVLEIEIGRGGCPGDADGYAIVVTELREQDST